MSRENFSRTGRFVSSVNFCTCASPTRSGLLLMSFTAPSLDSNTQDEFDVHNDVTRLIAFRSSFETCISTTSLSVPRTVNLFKT